MGSQFGATRVFFSDASSTGYDGYTVELGPEFAHGQWSADELVLSSTWCEKVLQSFASKLGHSVKWFSAVVQIVKVSSGKPQRVPCLILSFVFSTISSLSWNGCPEVLMS